MIRPVPSSLALAAIAALSTGCASSTPSAAELRGASIRSEFAESAPAAFAALERRLVSAPSIGVDFSIVASGAVEADVTGRLRVAHGNRVRMTASGTFAGRPIDLKLVSDGTVMRRSTPTGTVDVETPDELNDAVLIGMTRMGLLHNIAMLAGGAPPDHADGGVRDWTRVEDLRLAVLPEEAAGLLAVDMALRVAGEPAGTARLHVEPSTGNPKSREQRVQFPQGEMLVVERYDRVELGGSMDGVSFAPGS